MTHLLTKTAYIATRVCDTPFWALFNLLPIIIFKDLHATPFQIAVVVAVKPLVSLFSMYWSFFTSAARNRLVANIIWARVLSYIPFFFFPYFNNPWFYVFAFGFYMMMSIGSYPAWMELLKQNLPCKTREKVFSYTQAFGYMGGGVLPFFLGSLLDTYFQAWRWLFPLSACIGLTAILFQMKMPAPHDQPSLDVVKNGNLFTYLTKPWKSAWEKVSERKDFRQFQIGFMLLGCGLMVIQPALPTFFVNELKLSYTELSLAITLCKGAGFVAASPFWSRWIHQMGIYRLSSVVAIFGCLFPLLLIYTPWGTPGALSILYVAYFLYGLMQSGNEFIWNMSGPIFSQKENSAIYSSVNIVSIGLRGIFIPLLGTLLMTYFSCYFSMALSVALLVAAALYFRRKSPAWEVRV